MQTLLADDHFGFKANGKQGAVFYLSMWSLLLSLYHTVFSHTALEL